MTRYAVIGDLAGHAAELRAELLRLGADPDTGRLPDDLTVVQVGDLVHRGPDSEGVIALVDAYLSDQPGQWVQLAGNHEAQYLRTPVFEWRERIDATAVEILRRWWDEGVLRIAAHLDVDGEQFLVTHAGLTEPFWCERLGAPASARTTADALNAMGRADDDSVFAAGQMLGGGEPDALAGPLWAATATELVPSWLDVKLPFSQVHGHASLADWGARRFIGSPALAELTLIDEESKHTAVVLRGGRIIGVDPGHGRRPRRPWRAFELPEPAEPMEPQN